MRLLSTAVVTALFAAVIVPLATAPAQAADPGAILFEDGFIGAAGALPDQSKWEDWSTATYNSTAAYGNIKPGNDERLNGKGQLVIPATPGAGAALRSKYAFTYGTMSAWIKNPPQQGYWPAFWSLNNNRNGVDAAAIGEADAMEFYSTWPEAYHAVGHTWVPGSPGHHSPDHYCPAAGLTTGFNKFSATIEPGKITFSINDQVCGSYVKQAGQPWGFGPDVTRPNWMILNLANDTRGGAEVVAPTQAAQLLVERVEVRALPTTTPGIVSGANYELVNACAGKVAEVPTAQVGVDRARVLTGDDANTTNERWKFVATTGGYYKLLNVASGRALRLQSTSTAGGVLFVQDSNTSGAQAEFKPVDVGSGNYRLVNRYSGQSVKVTANSVIVGATIEQRAADAGCGQKWKLTKV